MIRKLAPESLYSNGFRSPVTDENFDEVNNAFNRTATKIRKIDPNGIRAREMLLEIREIIKQYK